MSRNRGAENDVIECDSDSLFWMWGMSRNAPKVLAKVCPEKPHSVCVAPASRFSDFAPTEAVITGKVKTGVESGFHSLQLEGYALVTDVASNLRAT
jgi:hypothetical protein